MKAHTLNRNVTMVKVMLELAYKNAVKQRTKVYGLIRIPDKMSTEIAEQLGSARLAKLYIRAQFCSLPVEFCQRNFNRDYPPANVVFGGECWRRYEEYLERGIDDGS